MLPTLDQRLIAVLRERGCDVTDCYGQLPTNPMYPYGRMIGGAGGIRQIAVHYTGDRFSAATLGRIVGAAMAGDGAIPPNLSRDEELDLLRWYAAYHLSKDGGAWGGLAYVVLVLPSGRIYWAWPLGTLTYHAFNANASALAVCCPLSNDAAPTPQQLASLGHVLDVLSFHAPELPAGADAVWGHQELTFLDPRNVTACPGPLLPFVQRYRRDAREWAAPPPLAPQSRPTAADPHAQHFRETDKWLIDPLLAYWRDNGGLPVFGLPVTGLSQDATTGLLVQWFERARLEVAPDGTITRGRVGAELAAALGMAEGR